MVIAMFVLRPSIARSDTLYGLVDLNVRRTNTDVDGQKATSTVVTQGYTLGGTKILTSVISLTGNVLYSITDVDGDKRENIFPTLTLNYTPRSMYNFSLAYIRTEIAPTEGVRISTSNLRAAFTVPPTVWPSLLLSFNRSTSQDYDTPHKIDIVNTRFGLTTGYKFSVLDTETRLIYSFSDSITEDNVSLVKTDSPKQEATIDISRTFWDKKITTYLNGGYSVLDIMTTSTGAPSRFEQTLAASRGLFSINPTPISGFLVDSPGLIDTDRQVAVPGIDLKNAFNNIGLQLPTAQGVHRIDLYIKTSDARVSSYNFGWQLYISDDSFNWTPLPSTVTYDPFNSRFQFAFPERTSQYFKVVNSLPSAGITAINITEVEAIGFLLETPTQTVSNNTIRNFAGYKFTIKPIERLYIDYGLNYVRTLQSLDDSESNSISQDLALNLKVYSSQHLAVTSGFSILRNYLSRDISGKPSKATDSGSDNYFLVFVLTPLPTLGANLSYNHFITLNNRETSNIFDGVATSVSMKLYAGADANVGASLSKSEQPLTDSTTDTHSESVKITLVPRSYLNIVFDANRSTSTVVMKGEQTTSTGKSSDAIVSYTPTRKLFLSANFTFEPIPLQGYSVSWLPTKKIQTNLSWIISQDITNESASINWVPLSYMTIYMSYNRSESEGMTHSKEDSLFAKVGMQF